MPLLMQSVQRVHGATDDCCAANLWGLDYPRGIFELDRTPTNTSTTNNDDNGSTEGLSSICINILYMSKLSRQICDFMIQQLDQPAAIHIFIFGFAQSSCVWRKMHVSLPIKQ